MTSFGRGLAALLALWTAGAAADELVVRKPDGGERTLEGRILASDSTGAVLFETRDSQHLVLPKDQVVRSEKSETPTPLWNRAELKAALAAEYGKDFRVTEMGGYVIVHSCSMETAKEAGRLLGKAQNNFITYFSKGGGFKLSKARQPLIAVVFDGREQYVAYVSRYLGPMAENTLGVYLPNVNRIFLYNAFGGDAGRQVELASRIDPAFARKVSTQMFGQNVSTLVHEAVHQAAYNTGFHNRKVVDYPLWLVEGMAMYFETTDTNGAVGWKGGKTVNPERAACFRAAYQRGLRSGFLERLIVDDGLLRDPTTAQDGYALSWTVTFYLLKHHKSEYMEYVRLINARPEFKTYPRAARLKDFETAFKMPPADMEAQFLARIVRILKE